MEWTFGSSRDQKRKLRNRIADNAVHGHDRAIVPEANWTNFSRTEIFGLRSGCAKSPDDGRNPLQLILPHATTDCAGRPEMAWNRVLRINDPLQCRTALLNTDFEILPRAKGIFQADFTQVGLNRMRLARYHLSLPQVSSVTLDPGRKTFGFLTESSSLRYYGKKSQSVTSSSKNRTQHTW